MSLLIFLYVFSLPIGLTMVAVAVRDQRRQREEARYRAEHGFPKCWYPERQLDLPDWHGEVPAIQPPRAPDATAHVRLVPHPMDYRKFIRVIEGASEDPLEAYVPLGTHGTGPT